MFVVYILQSLKDANRHYVSFTADLDKRLAEHNQGLSRYTRAYRPWQVMSYTVFREKKTAQSFEKYLKSGSGHAFLRKRLVFN